MVLAREWEDFGQLRDYQKDNGEKLWKPLMTSTRVGVWTDDYSNLLGVFEWGN